MSTLPPGIKTAAAIGMLKNDDISCSYSILRCRIG